MTANFDRTNLGDILRRDRPDHTAFIDLRDSEHPREWTIAGFDDAIKGFARGLGSLGVRRGDRIAILAENRVEFLVAYFGIMRAGLTAVPINFRLARDTVTYIFGDAAIKATVVDSARRSLVPEGVAVIALDAHPGIPFAQFLNPGAFQPTIPAGEEIAKILYTSGSTGRPKGVPLTHAGQLWALGKDVEAGDAMFQDRTLIVAPTYHKNGLFFSMVALANGLTIVSLPRFDARTYLEAAARYRATILSGIPTMFALMARERDLLDRLDLSSIRSVTIGSAPLTDALITKVQAIFPNASIQNGYGTTEAGPSVFGAHPQGVPCPALSLGYPFPDIEWRLDGPSPDEGVLHLKTPATMPGYLNLPGVTAERLRNGWYDTGDIMQRDEHGFFAFVGRADDMFICGGENIYPGEVEKLLERCPGVLQAAVVPAPDEIKGQIPVAFVVRLTGATVSTEEIKAFSLREGPAFSHPRFVIIKDRIPVAGTHKVDRRLLIEEARALARSFGRS